MVDAVEEVPVVVQELGDAAQVVEPGAAREQDQQRRLELGIVEEIVTGAPPPLVEREQRRDFVVDFDTRRQAGLDRERGEDPLRERVERADRGVVEVVEGVVAAIARDRVERVVAGAVLELRAHTIAELGRGLLGERDRGHASHRHGEVGTVDRDQLDDPIDQDRRLPGARAGLDEEHLVEARAHRFARGAVGENERHASTASKPAPISSM